MSLWRYENYGSAAFLSVEGTTLKTENSKFGTAFYQTQQVPCFDIAGTKELWCKFDVYFDGSTYFKAGSQYGDFSGIQSNEDSEIRLYSFGSRRAIVSAPSIKGKVSTILLHMVWGNGDGLIEFWLDGIQQYSYTGYTEHSGDSFDHFYLQSAGEGTYFSNVIISNEEIGLDEDAHPYVPISIEGDTARTLRNHWRYLNAGHREKIVLMAEETTDNTKTNTGIAFCQTNSNAINMFCLPNTLELWCKFDGYIGGSTYIAAWENANTGLRFNSNAITVLKNGSELSPIYGDFSGLHTYLLHLLSDATEGIIEVWCDGAKLYEFTGDVYGGNSITKFTLYSNADNHYVSNIIISDVQIGLNDNVVDTAAPWKQPYLSANGTFGVDDFAVRSSLSSSYKVFDSSTGYLNATNTNAYIDFYSKTALQVNQLFIWSSDGYLPATGTLLYSDDGDNFTECGSWNDTSNSVWAVVGCYETAAHSYWRLLVTSKSIAYPSSNADISNVHIDTGTSILQAGADAPIDVDILLCVSRQETGTADIFRHVARQEMDNAGTYRQITRAESGVADTVRNIIQIETGSADIFRRITCNSQSVGDADILRCIARAESSDTDIYRHIESGAIPHQYTNIGIPDDFIFATATGVDDSGVSTTGAALTDTTPRQLVSVAPYFGEACSDLWLALDYCAMPGYSVDVFGLGFMFVLDGGYYMHSEGATRSVDYRPDDFDASPYNDGNIAHVILHASGDGYELFVNNEFVTAYSGNFGSVIQQMDIWTENGIALSNVSITENAPTGFVINGSGLVDISLTVANADSERTETGTASIFRKVARQEGGTVGTVASITRRETGDIVLRRLIPHKIEVPNGTPLPYTPPAYIPAGSVPSAGGTASATYIPAGKDTDGISMTVNPPKASGHMRAIDIQMSLGQLTDTISYETAGANIEPKEGLHGQYLDYDYSMLVESTRTEGITQQVTCVVDADLLTTRKLCYRPAMLSALGHLQRVAEAIGKKLVARFDDFRLLSDLVPGETPSPTPYITMQNIMQNVFSWTQNLPKQQISVYIRGDTVYAVQRGRESGLVAIDGLDISRPQVAKELYRVETIDHLNSTTTVITTNYINNTRNEPDDDWWHFPDDTDDTNPGENSASNSYKDGHIKRRVQKWINSSDGTTTTIDYDYDTAPSGERYLVAQTEKTSYGDGRDDETTVTHYEYDGYGQYTATKWVVRVGGDGNSEGQGTVSYNFVGSTVGHGQPSHTITDYDKRHTGYNQMRKARDDGDSGGNGASSGLTPQISADAERAQELFPVYGWPKYVDLYNAMNMTVKESISFTLYDYSHVIGFDDRISWQGKEYFLESNNVHKDTQVTNQQTITAVRWY